VRDVVDEVVRDEELATRAAFTAPPQTMEPVRATAADASPRNRRRRSSSALPSHLEPVEVPDDAPGRVEYISVEMPEAVAVVATVTDADAAQSPHPMAADPTVANPWVAVVTLGVLLVVLFVVGMAITR
jgi:hypothetical protein